MNTCETCRWWARGRVYTQERYGNTPERVAWSAVFTGEYTTQDGECRIVAPSRRSRFVGHDDLSPDDYTVACPRCLGTGAVDYDPEDEVEEWMR